jgi:hypothetical protein
MWQCCGSPRSDGPIISCHPSPVIVPSRDSAARRTWSHVSASFNVKWFLSLCGSLLSQATAVCEWWEELNRNCRIIIAFSAEERSNRFLRNVTTRCHKPAHRHPVCVCALVHLTHCKEEEDNIGFFRRSSGVLGFMPSAVEGRTESWKWRKERRVICFLFT